MSDNFGVSFFMILLEFCRQESTTRSIRLKPFGRNEINFIARSSKVSGTWVMVRTNAMKSTMTAVLPFSNTGVVSSVNLDRTFFAKVTFVSFPH